MAKLRLETSSSVDKTMDFIYREFNRRAEVSPRGTCPAELALSFLRLCYSQTCGKCVPCRIGLGQLEKLICRLLDGDAEEGTVDLIEQTAKVIADSADCEIGSEAAATVLKAVHGSREDFLSHEKTGRCLVKQQSSIQCQSTCPAHVDIPGYIALTGQGKYDEAMALIRKDNPFPSVCGYVCEHPCETRCRRNMVDSGVNICGIKRFAADHSRKDLVPAKAEATGKKVAVVGGGPAGLTAAYYLSLMGHSVKVFDQRDKLGGMLRYGIPDYRLPQDVLDRDINHILRQGVEVETGVAIESAEQMNKLRKQYDAVLIATGAHVDRKLGVEGEDAQNVISAVELLRAVGGGARPDFKGKTICVIGGGNVAMDCTRTCLRLGAAHVKCLYRRRLDDMTAIREEIEDAQTEGVEMMPMQAPHHVEKGADGKVSAMWIQPQIIGRIGNDGRPSVRSAQADTVRIPCDYVIVAIGQAILIKPFADAGLATQRGTIVTDSTSQAYENVFAAGDAVTGPATVIRAVAAGKVAASNIDAFLGFNHEITCDVEIPGTALSNTPACGRVQTRLRNFDSLAGNFTLASEGMTDEECKQECSRCLRCDHFGLGVLKGGRTVKW
ncbi:MAG: FAD-dependent oxidoreductase [Spirochaetales bacterium]|nr:FAD-dependent oxidoreductase [Spirochaetales bacterium]MBQ7507802.1 FAD-dependent oxidoreductase [Spirochaetales bacterium]